MRRIRIYTRPSIRSIAFDVQEPVVDLKRSARGRAAATIAASVIDTRWCLVPPVPQALEDLDGAPPSAHPPAPVGSGASAASFSMYANSSSVGADRVFGYCERLGFRIERHTSSRRGTTKVLRLVDKQDDITAGVDLATLLEAFTPSHRIGEYCPARSQIPACRAALSLSVSGTSPRARWLRQSFDDRGLADTKARRSAPG